jgi:hypothetical protein
MTVGMVIAIIAVGIALFAIGTYIGFISKRDRPPKHVHTWKAVRVAQFTVTKTRGRGLDWLGPWTRVSWRCIDCGRTRTTDLRGFWRPEDFND